MVRATPASKPAKKAAKAATSAADSKKKQPLGKKGKVVESSSDDDDNSDVELQSNSSSDDGSDIETTTADAAKKRPAPKKQPGSKRSAAAKQKQAASDSDSDSDDDADGAAAKPKAKPKCGNKKKGAAASGDGLTDAEAAKLDAAAPLDYEPDKCFVSKATNGDGEFKKNPIKEFGLLESDFSDDKNAGDAWSIFTYVQSVQDRLGTRIDPAIALMLSADRSNFISALFWSGVTDDGRRKHMQFARVRVLAVRRTEADYNDPDVREGKESSMLLVRWADVTTGAMKPRGEYLPHAGRAVAWVHPFFVLCK